MQLTVIICSHNPRAAFLERVLESLQAQSLPLVDWELLLIDNLSTPVISDRYDLSWHPNARHIREDELGLTPARLRGIREATSDLLVFVDDDNILLRDYLATAFEMAQKMPFLGVFNGTIEGEFEVPVPTFAKKSVSMLAVRPVYQTAWACLPGTKALKLSLCGAGLCIRTTIARSYFEEATRDPIRLSLDRKGNELTSAGDSDMVLHACSMGYAAGVFPSLNLTHLIPKERLTEAYLLRLTEAMTFSHALLEYIWDGRLPKLSSVNRCRADDLLDLYKRIRRPHRKSPEELFADKSREAVIAGKRRALAVLESLRLDSVNSPSDVGCG